MTDGVMHIVCDVTCDWNELYTFVFWNIILSKSLSNLMIFYINLGVGDWNDLSIKW